MEDLKYMNKMVNDLTNSLKEQQDAFQKVLAKLPEEERKRLQGFSDRLTTLANAKEMNVEDIHSIRKELVDLAKNL